MRIQFVGGAVFEVLPKEQAVSGHVKRKVQFFSQDSSRKHMPPSHHTTCDYINGLQFIFASCRCCTKSVLA